MSYSPINTQAFVNSYAGAIAGMAVSGWIVDPTSIDYASVASIAGAFAQAFDLVWNDATALNNLEVQAIQSVCQEEFKGRGPGSLSNPDFALASHWTVPAAACAALVLEGDAYFAGQGINPGTPPGPPPPSSFAPIQNVRFYDAAFAGTPNGSIAQPYVLFQTFWDEVDASPPDSSWELMLPAGPITVDAPQMPDFGDNQNIALQGAMALMTQSGGTELDSLNTGFQTGSLSLQLHDLSIADLRLNGSESVRAFNCRLSSVSQGGTYSGTMSLYGCRIADFSTSAVLNLYDCTIGAGATVQLNGGDWSDVVIEDSVSVTFESSGTMTLKDVTFGASCFFGTSGGGTLNLDEYSWSQIISLPVTTNTNLSIRPLPTVMTAIFLSGPIIGPGQSSDVDCGLALIMAEWTSTGGLITADYGPTPPNFPDVIISYAYVANDSRVHIVLRNTSLTTTRNVGDLTVTITYTPRVTA